MHRKAELQQTTSASVADVTPSYSDKESDAVDDSVESSLASLFDSSNIADTIPFKLVDRTELIMLQQSGLDLSSLFELANRGDDHYCIRSGVLVRSWRDKLAPPESRIHQVIVPTTLRPKLLQIAHNIPAARHLGIAKTQSRLLWHFFSGKVFLVKPKTFAVLAMFASVWAKVRILQLHLCKVYTSGERTFCSSRH